METLKKRDILQDVITEYGYSGWYVIDTGNARSETCLLFNPKEKKMAEVSIPDQWLDDPHRQPKIRESLAWTIQNCSYILPQAHLSSFRSGTEPRNALDEKNQNNENRLFPAVPTNRSK